MKKQYELVDHLGNVLVTVSDMKMAHEETGNPGFIDYYLADVRSAQDYYPGGMIMPGRMSNSNAYRFGHNGQLKDDEISGTGNMYTAEFWEYDCRTIRRWNREPKMKLWESPYATFSNNPIWYKDPLGLDVINAHEKERDKAQNKVNTAKEKFSKFKKGEKGYRSAKRELRKAKNNFNKINAKYLRVEEKIKEIKVKDPDLFEKADKLTDPGGTKVDIYVSDVPNDILNIGVDEGYNIYGTTTALPGYQVKSYNNSFPDYYSVKSEKGMNTIEIKISDISLTWHLAHEFGHAIYQAKNTLEYLKWLDDHPSEQNKGGHGKNDPSGTAAINAETKFK